MKKRLKTFGIDFGVAALICSLIFVVYAQTVLTPMNLTGGIYPLGSYTVFSEGTNYFAKDAWGNIDYSGTNASLVINNAFSTLTAGRTWIETVILKGSFSLSGELNLPSNTELRIYGRLIATVATMNLIHAKDVHNIRIIGGEFSSSVVKTEGAAIYLEHIYADLPMTNLNNRIEDVHIFQPFYGIKIIDSYEVFVEHVDVREAVYAGIFIDGGNDHYIENFVIDGDPSNATTFGLQIRQTGGTWITNGDIMRCQYGTVIDPLTGDTVQNLFFLNTALGDSCEQNGALFTEANGGDVLSVYATSSWVSANTFSGMTITGGQRYVLTAMRFQVNMLYGLEISGATTYVEVNGGDAYGNGQWGYYEGGTSNYNTVIGLNAASNGVGGIHTIGANTHVNLSWNATTWIP